MARGQPGQIQKSVDPDHPRTRCVDRGGGCRKNGKSASREYASEESTTLVDTCDMSWRSSIKSHAYVMQSNTP